MISSLIYQYLESAIEAEVAGKPQQLEAVTGKPPQLEAVAGQSPQLEAMAWPSSQLEVAVLSGRPVGLLAFL